MDGNLTLAQVDTRIKEWARSGSGYMIPGACIGNGTILPRHLTEEVVQFILDRVNETPRAGADNDKV